uniref:Aminotransferase-like plant mobile domain-containing protein n=1 Tax=Quercus lobata TaxID=97700 RepID=A0A7N2N7B8_QUELO
MFSEFIRNLHDPRQYSWGSGCLAWLYRDLCRASEKEPPPGCDYGPWTYAPLAFKWVQVPSSKSRPSGTALVRYREQLVTMQPDQIVWQPYEADFGHLPEFCVAGRDTWTARVPLVCFCIVERHYPDRVLRQFGLAQQQPDNAVYDDRLHKIDLRGKIQSHLALLEMLPEGSEAYNHVRRVLNNVAGLGRDPAANEEADNGHETEPTVAEIPSTSAAPVSTRTRAQRAIASPSTSAARGHGRPATTSPSTSATRGRGMPATASPSTSAARGRGRRATTPRVVTSLEMPAPIPHSSPQPEVPPHIPDASPQPEVRSPSPPSQPDFDLSIDDNVTPPILPETPSYPPTSSTAPTPGLYLEHHYPPTASSSDPLGPPVGIDTVQPHTDVPNEYPPHQPSPPRGRPQCTRRAPTCGTGGHKIGHRGSSMIKLNHRKLLDGMLDICGVPPQKFRTICSSIDKLDKQPFEQIKKEMVEEKGLSVQTADEIGTFVKERGHPLELLSKLKQQGSKFLGHNGSADALNDLEILFKALEVSKCIDKVVFDLSLARGLDYYTGVISEAVFKGRAQDERSLCATERPRAIFELAIAQPALDMPELLWKVHAIVFQ